MLTAVTPATGKPIAEYPALPPAAIRAAVRDAHPAFGSWRDRPIADRARLLAEAARVLEAGKAESARLMAQEMGKPVSAGESEVEKCAWVCRYVAEQGEAFLAPLPVATDAGRSYVAFRPLGLVLAIMPWNFPFRQVFRFAAPGLLAHPQPAGPGGDAHRQRRGWTPGGPERRRQAQEDRAGGPSPSPRFRRAEPT